MEIIDEVNEVTFIDGVRDIGVTKSAVKFSMFQVIARAKDIGEAEVYIAMRSKVVMTHESIIEFAAQLEAVLAVIKPKAEEAKD